MKKIISETKIPLPGGVGVGLPTMKVLYVILFFLLFPFLSISQTITVKQDGTGDFTTIQAAIDSAQNGDTVLVWPGVYMENIIISDKSLTLGSLTLTTGDLNYMYQTIIDGNHVENCLITKLFGNIVINGFTFRNGKGSNYDGGGLCINGFNGTIRNCYVHDNVAEIYAGGIFVHSSDVILSNVTVTRNLSYRRGGGILVLKGTVTFDSINRCNIYENYSAWGTDIFKLGSPPMEVYVDTFTVQNPDYYYVYSPDSMEFPRDDIKMHILHHKTEQAFDDLYVSPTGDNNNSGLTPDSPLKNISFALLKMGSDSVSPDTIHIANGTYSFSSGEKFPLSLKNFVTLKGETKDSVILDAEYKTYHMHNVIRTGNFSIMNLTTTHGKVMNDGTAAGSVRLDIPNNVKLENLCLRDNESYYNSTLLIGTALNVKLKNVDFINNKGDFACEVGHYPSDKTYDTTTIINCRFINNTYVDSGSYYYAKGGALMLFGSGYEDSVSRNAVFLINNLFAGNSTKHNLSNIYIAFKSNTYMINNTIVDNFTANGSVVVSIGEDCVFEAYNSIFYNKYLKEIGVYGNDVGIYNSLIDGGRQGIKYGYDTLEIDYDSTNLDTDPLFYNAEDSVYTLSAESPCINAGTMDLPQFILDRMPATDLAGNPRIYNNKIDIGAYEWNDIGINEPQKSSLNSLSVFPNPFGSQTVINAKINNPERVNLLIYNSSGLPVKTLQNGFQPAGEFQLIWDGTNQNGTPLPAGIYIILLTVNGKETGSVVKVMKR